MGTVFLAERADGQYRKQVAVKLIIPICRWEGVRRFLMNVRCWRHWITPYAKLLDGGATGNGTPYLVMDYIEGDRIDHCVTDATSL